MRPEESVGNTTWGERWGGQGDNAEEMTIPFLPTRSKDMVGLWVAAVMMCDEGESGPIRLS